MLKAVGLDIAGGGWALVEISLQDGCEPQLSAKTVPYGQLDFDEATTLAIADVPIGLLNDQEAKMTKRGQSGDRQVDRGARRWCRSSSSVFPPPTEGQLRTGMREHRRAASGQTAEERRRKLTEVAPGGLSKQSFELLPAIEDVAKMKSKQPDRIFESHPEVVFSVLAGGVVPVSKASPTGAMYRAALLTNRPCSQVLCWVLRQEAATGIAAEHWIDAVSMAVVAYDWIRDPASRRMLSDESGHVWPWQDGQLERIMALPHTDLVAPPRRLELTAVVEQVLSNIQPQNKTASPS